jgi:hypothetical protein
MSGTRFVNTELMQTTTDHKIVKVFSLLFWRIEHMGIIINADLLTATSSALLDGHIGYSLGAKAPSLDCAPADISQLDCSGFSRYLLYQATDKQIMLPDGSSNQLSWCKTNRLAKVAYSNAASYDGWLRIAFIEPNKKRAGHVWFVLNGMTLESHAGKGPDQRSWRTPVLVQEVTACYKVAQAYIILCGGPGWPPHKLAGIL